jgi:transcription initiation factor TFIIB
MGTLIETTRCVESYYVAEREKWEEMIEYINPTPKIFPNMLFMGVNEKKYIKPEREEINVDKLMCSKTAPKDIWDIFDTTDIKETVEVKQNNKFCSECNNKLQLVLDPQTSMSLCYNCGIVVDQQLGEEEEWGSYGADDGDALSRYGCPNSHFFPESSQGTIMVGTKNSRLARKQKWNSTTYKEKALSKEFDNMTKICKANNIPKNIIDDAKIYFKTLSECKHDKGQNKGRCVIVRGHNRISIVASCVFKACQKNKSPRSIREIARFFNLPEKKITSGNKQFEKIMATSKIRVQMSDEYHETDSVEDYLRRHKTSLGLKQSHVELAVKMGYNCAKLKIASAHNPQSIAAGIMMSMAEYKKLNIEKLVVARYFGTSDVTINKIYSEVNDYVAALVDDDTTDYLVKKHGL